jgi:hypothetical protein
MDEKTLKSFCSTDELRPSLMQPYNKPEFTMATDGHVLIRIPKMEGYDGNVGPSSDDLFGSIDYGETNFVGLPEPRIEPCKCKCGNEHTKNVWDKTQIGERHFYPRIMERISVLPNVRIMVPGGAHTAAYIKFDGGDGLIMPYRV